MLVHTSTVVPEQEFAIGTFMDKRFVMATFCFK